MTVSANRRRVNRCEAREVESPRSCRCQLRAGHPGEHVSYSGHRYWGGRVRHKLAEITSDLWHVEGALLSEDGSHDGRPTARTERR
jgi:hypothetical protein